jgi:hypothetical protein
MKLYKYVSCETLSFILKGKIRFTQPSAFNDPFELAVQLYSPSEIKEGKFPMDFDITLPREELGEYKLSDDFKSETCSDVNGRSIKAELDKTIGILCLSKNKDSHLMWAHYAQSYSGALIEFDTDNPFFNGLIDVEYCSLRPKININYFINRQSPIPLSTLFVKLKEYEAEVRMARNIKDLEIKKSKNGQPPIYLANLPLECIKSITLGERTSINDKRIIYNKIKETNISLNFSTISNWEYEFHYEAVKMDKPIPVVSPWISPTTADLSGFGEVARMIRKNEPLKYMFIHNEKSK